MANMTIQTKEAANGYIVDVSFYGVADDDGNGFAQNQYEPYGKTRYRSYIAKDKAEMKEIITNLMDAE